LVGETHVTADLPLHKLLEMINAVIHKVSQEDFNGFSQHNKSLERQYLDTNGVVTDVVDVKLITFHSDRECDSLTDSKSSSSSGERSS
jgi:hypothetical protein